MAKLEVSERTRIRRVPTREVIDRAVLNRIVDESYLCHVGFVDRDHPFVIPTFGWRDQDSLFIHGSRGSRMLQVLSGGARACITFTLLDGLVLARSAFHHSANYRSVVILGQLTVVQGEQERLRVLELFMEKIAPGRWSQLRETSQQEIAATEVLTMNIEEASVKVRQGDPGDDEEDLLQPVWAGTLPIRQVVGPAVSAANNLADQPVPDFSAAFGDRWRSE